MDVKRRVPRQARTRVPGRGRELAELRRRAGLHGKRRKDRANANRSAIAADWNAG